MDSSSSSSAGASGCATGREVEGEGSLCCSCHSVDDEAKESTKLALCVDSMPVSVREEEEGFSEAGVAKLGERGREASPLEAERLCSREELE